MTAALEGGEWSAARPVRTLPPGKTRYPFYRRLGGPQGRSERAKNLVPTGIRSRTVQPIVSRYTDWATRPTTEMSTRNISWVGNGCRCLGLTTLPPLVTIVLKSGSLSLLEHSAPAQACNGICFIFIFTFTLAFALSSYLNRIASCGWYWVVTGKGCRRGGRGLI